LCWSFYRVNDNIEIDLENTQIMRCILCYQKVIIGINSRSQARKKLISYYKKNGIISLKNMWMQNTLLLQKRLKK
jgi:hypothetical protein